MVATANNGSNIIPAPTVNDVLVTTYKAILRRAWRAIIRRGTYKSVMYVSVMVFEISKIILDKIYR